MPCLERFEVAYPPEDHWSDRILIDMANAAAEDSAAMESKDGDRITNTCNDSLEVRENFGISTGNQSSDSSTLITNSDKPHGSAWPNLTKVGMIGWPRISADAMAIFLRCCCSSLRDLTVAALAKTPPSEMEAALALGETAWAIRTLTKLNLTRIKLEPTTMQSLVCC
jgi:hypothetical protein